MNALQQMHALLSSSHTPDPPRATAQNSGSPRLLPRRSAEWDPYEVWRTRIKPPHDPAQAAWDRRR